MTAVRLHDVARTFDGGRGVSTVSAHVEQGETVALLGASGSGKSTLLQLMAGTVLADRGTVTVLGQNPASATGAARKQLRSRVGVLYQAGNLTPGLRVVHNVLMSQLGRWSTARALMSLVAPRAADVEAARQALGRVELQQRLWAWPDELSGGEQQRVALARLMLQRPELWLADEPTAGLDARLRRAMIDTLLAIVREQGASVVVALHDLELIEADFDRVFVLRQGRLVLTERAADVPHASVRALYEARP